MELASIALHLTFDWLVARVSLNLSGISISLVETRVGISPRARKVDRAAVLVVLGVTIFVGAMFGRLSLGGLVHFEIVNGCEREASFGEEKPDSEGSARVDFSNFFAERMSIKLALEK